jgi:hypothetical protein
MEVDGPPIEAFPVSGNVFDGQALGRLHSFFVIMTHAE